VLVNKTANFNVVLRGEYYNPVSKEIATQIKNLLAMTGMPNHKKIVIARNDDDNELENCHCEECNDEAISKRKGKPHPYEVYF